MRSSLVVTAATLSALLLAGCDGGGGGVQTPTVPSTLATAGIAASSTETGEPFAINDGAFAFNDTSETAEPRRINR